MQSPVETCTALVLDGLCGNALRGVELCQRHRIGLYVYECVFCVFCVCMCVVCVLCVLCVHVHVSVCIYVFTYNTYTYIHTSVVTEAAFSMHVVYAYVCMYIHTYACTYAYTHADKHTPTHPPTHVPPLFLRKSSFIHTHTTFCVFLYICVCIYTYVPLSQPWPEQKPVPREPGAHSRKSVPNCALYITPPES